MPEGWFEVDLPTFGPVCSDRACPCPETDLARHGGYLLVTDELVSFRRDLRSVADVRAQFAGRSVFFGPGVAVPIAMCESAARTRGIDLDTARADYDRWIRTKLVPLRTTPKQGALSKPAVLANGPDRDAGDGADERISHRRVGDGSEGIEVTRHGLRRLIAKGWITPDDFEIREGLHGTWRLAKDVAWAWEEGMPPECVPPVPRSRIVAQPTRSESRAGRSAVSASTATPTANLPESGELSLARRLRGHFANPWILSCVLLVVSALVVGTFVWLGSNAGSDSTRDEARTRADGEDRLAAGAPSSTGATRVLRDAGSSVDAEVTATGASVAVSSTSERSIDPNRASSPPAVVASQDVVPAAVEAKPPVVEASPVGELRRFEGHGDAVSSVAASRDGRRILSGSRDETIRLWDVDTGRELLKIQAHAKGVRCVALSADAKLGLSVGSDRALRLWDLESGKKIRDFAYDGEGERALALSPDASMALSAGSEGRVRLWDVRTGTSIRVFEGHTNAVTDVVFTPDGRRALSSSHDLTARLWDVETGRELRRFEGHTGYVHCVAMSPDGLHVLTGSGGRMSNGNMVTSRDTGARLWDPTSGKEIRKLIHSRIFVNGLAIAPDGRRVLSSHGGALVAAEGGRITGAFGGSDGQVHLWDLETGKELHAFDGHGEAVLCVAFLGDGRRAISSGVDGTIRLWGLPE